MDNSEFYNTLSANYDDMINFKNSLINKMTSLEKFIIHDYHTALDFGCGTGIDSIALSKLGFLVDAVDHSSGMLDKAAKNAEEFGININFIQSGLGELNLNDNNYDLIVSLGNTIANIDENELRKLLNNLVDHLNESGQILIQLINYAKLPSSGSYILNEYEDDSLSIIRKYEINPNDIDFIIDRVNKTTNQNSKIVTKLYPHSVNFFNLFAKENNLIIKLFGNLKRESYIEDESQNLVILMSK